MFTGFTPETFDFLWGIRMNNNREWFQAHKPQYVNTLYEPMKALGAELFTPFQEKPGNLLKVSRIYRDARLHHPLPYKESLWICIRQDVEWWAQNPCLYFEIRPEGVSYGFFLWKAPSASMDAFRKRITSEPDRFLELVQSTEEKTGVPISAVCYKRPKAAEDPKLQRFFDWKEQIGCVIEEAPGDSLFTPELAVRVREFFRDLMPLYDYFNQFKV